MQWRKYDFDRFGRRNLRLESFGFNGSNYRFANLDNYLHRDRFGRRELQFYRLDYRYRKRCADRDNFRNDDDLQRCKHDFDRFGRNELRMESGGRNGSNYRFADRFNGL